MKKFLKVLLILVIIIVVAIGAFFAYIYFKPTKIRDIHTLIPEDAIFMIETNNFTKGWAEINGSEMWQKMMENEYFADINASAMSLDSLIGNNETMNMLFEDRNLYITSHMISGVDYDFMFFVDLKQASKLSFLTDLLSNSILNQFDYSMNRSKVDDDEVIELVDNETGDIVYISIIDNIFMATYTPTLMEGTLKAKNDTAWINNSKFVSVYDEVNRNKRFHCYFNYSMLEKYMKCFVKESDDITKSLSKTLCYSAFNFHLEDKRLQFDGYTNYNDTVASYIKALASVKPGKYSAYEVLSQNTALYISMCFNDFNEFHDNLMEQYKEQDSAEYKSNMKQINRIEKFFKINLKEDFFSWIGSEVAFVKMKPKIGYSNEDDIVAVIRTDDLDLAKEKLAYIMKQVKRRSPVKFETLNYLNNEIHYLEIKGLFKLFFGKLFKKLDKPYFTYIEDYVVFSNSPENLKDMLDDYTKGNILVKDEKFMAFKDNFKNKCNANIFVRMPKMYTLLYYYSNADKKKAIKKNKELILSFSQVGFQMIADGELFKTNLISDFDEDALYNEEIQEFEASASEVSNDEVESLAFREEIDKLSISADSSGIFKVYFEGEDSLLKFEGSIVGGIIDGLWRSYYKSGNIKNAVNFKEGKLEGLALFYYDDDEQSIKVKARFENNKLEDLYREYYRNGVRMAQIPYKDGKAHGTAEYYYGNGNIKMQGKFKNGEEKGKWRYYNEDGELFERSKVKAEDED